MTSFWQMAVKYLDLAKSRLLAQLSDREHASTMWDETCIDTHAVIGLGLNG